jgi:hypothetical protein
MIGLERDTYIEVRQDLAKSTREGGRCLAEQCGQVRRQEDRKLAMFNKSTCRQTKGSGSKDIPNNDESYFRLPLSYISSIYHACI